MTAQKKFLFIFLLVYVVLNIIFLSASGLLAAWQINSHVLFFSNTFLFLLSIGVFIFQSKALLHSNPNVFVRSVMGGSMIKILLCAAAVMTYALANRSHFNKKILLFFLLLYIVYTTIEITAVSKLNKKKNG